MSKDGRIEIKERAILRRLDAVAGRPFGAGEVEKALSLLRLEGGDIDQPGHIRPVTGFRNHHAAVAVAHEQARALLEIEDTVGGRYIIGKRGDGLLHDRDVETTALKDLCRPAPG
ncbi:hypothetical protein D3C72_2055340 [compost metagenome]